jgi:predicted esterase
MAARRRRALRGCAALALLAACRSPRTSPLPPASATAVAAGASAVTLAPPAPRAESPAPAAAPPGLAPLVEPTPLVVLAVPGFGDAVVSVPLGADAARPIALALHGNFDRPEWQCQVWRRITRGEIFVLCPRGIPRRDVPKELDRWEWGSLQKTKAELLAALGALRARYPEHVARGPIVFTGFSLGAILGARLIHDQELNVGAAVLTEGGYQGWTASKARGLKPGLRRLLFACGQSECRNAYRYQLEALLERAGLSASMVADTKAGHTYDEPVASLIQGEWRGLLASVLSE